VINNIAIVYKNVVCMMLNLNHLMML